MKSFTAQEKLVWIRKCLDEGVELPPPETLMNTGARRTPEKREMLRQLRDRALARGQKPWPANWEAPTPDPGTNHPKPTGAPVMPKVQDDLPSAEQHLNPSCGSDTPTSGEQASVEGFFESPHPPPDQLQVTMEAIARACEAGWAGKVKVTEHGEGEDPSRRR